MPFPANTVVDVEQTTDTDWVTRKAIHYTGKVESFDVPTASPTDFASVPRVFVWLLPRYGRYTKAAILHDYLWRQRVRPDDLVRRDADAIFRRAMRDLNVPFLNRWVMWTAVRLAGMFRHRAAWSGWWKDVPRMVVFIALAVPIVAPPAVLILAALLAWTIAEALLWVPLKLWDIALRQFRPERSRKQVNAPVLSWKS